MLNNRVGTVSESLYGSGSTEALPVARLRLNITGYEVLIKYVPFIDRNVRYLTYICDTFTVVTVFHFYFVDFTYTVSESLDDFQPYDFSSMKIRFSVKNLIFPQQ
jgi:hypothetical protein